jgi:hypothetical protein
MQQPSTFKAAVSHIQTIHQASIGELSYLSLRDGI